MTDWTIFEKFTTMKHTENAVLGDESSSKQSYLRRFCSDHVSINVKLHNLSVIFNCECEFQETSALQHFLVNAMFMLC
jgi:hypothetical protein